jgi:CheY-like chemotaxis protein
MGQHEARKPVNVLLVDDNEALRTILKITLSIEPGIGEIEEAGDGDAAVKICGRFRPDVVILDYWMPFMDGETAADHIRELHPDVLIVAFSAVLGETPRWADMYWAKDDLPDASLLVKIARDGTNEIHL